MPEGFPLPYSSNDLSGQVALVTGSTSGLGWRFASVLARCGARVAITGRREERLATLADEIRGAGGECAPLRLDMTDSESILGVVERADGVGWYEIEQFLAPVRCHVTD